MNTEEYTKENKKEVLKEDKKLEYELKLYEECCQSYHRIDDFRAKLLGFLPLVTGAGIFVTLSGKIGGDLKAYYPQIGIFGFIVTLGLLVFEIKGIQKCTQIIKRGIIIEKFKFKTRGQFTEICDNASKIINEPVAAGLIYSIVLAAWMYIILKSFELAWSISGSVFFLSLAFVYIYWKHIIYRGLEKIIKA